jgi:serine/threonine protein kinase
MVCKKVRCDSEEDAAHRIREHNTSKMLRLAYCDHCFHIDFVRQQADTYTFRMYYEYAEHGDLASLMRLYRETEHRDKQIPEPFIWMVFHNLSDAIRAMNTGMCGTMHDAGQNFDNELFENPMVHLDIKPPNVFLCAGKHPYPAYPRPVLADYDVAEPISETLDTYPARTAVGTRGYQAPEVLSKSLWHHRITAKADVWAIGMVIWKLMHTTLGQRSEEISAASIDASFRFLDGDTFTSDEVPGYDAMYSNTLHTLVRDCLQINPEKRVGYEELRRRTKAGFAQSQKRIGSVEGEDIAEHLRVLVRQEREFLIGEEYQHPRVRKRRRMENAA